jgi:hypothetical protein
MKGQMGTRQGNGDAKRKKGVARVDDGWLDGRITNEPVPG